MSSPTAASTTSASCAATGLPVRSSRAAACAAGASPATVSSAAATPMTSATTSSRAPSATRRLRCGVAARRGTPSVGPRGADASTRRIDTSFADTVAGERRQDRGACRRQPAARCHLLPEWWPSGGRGRAHRAGHRTGARCSRNVGNAERPTRGHKRGAGRALRMPRRGRRDGRRRGHRWTRSFGVNGGRRAAATSGSHRARKSAISRGASGVRS